MKIENTKHNGINIFTTAGTRFSIIFGSGHYCQNRDETSGRFGEEKFLPETPDVEVAVIKGSSTLNSEWITNEIFPENGKHEEGSVDVYGYAEVGKVLSRIMEQERKEQS